ncbi:Phosphatidylinositol N-acetylglucosaminyltransferase subunit Q [Toxocara canis]|uniref:Phosphatidylinositol N-acetylglucosaminyltransferase subunit Q n=1 Tax=Toxocara canis TaxID=6265 RepID=A0A0B2UHT6_TOXCA|nr:Phosphatidylinositol N-acetylglucosaminyltransferase subunit Q [Toxocara canis]
MKQRRKNGPEWPHNESSTSWLSWSIIGEYIRSLIDRSAILARIKDKFSPPCRIRRQIIDSFLGILVWYLLVMMDLFPPDIFSVLTFTLISIEQLIIWISLYPAGLKLNSPLNSALSNFFLYHIYLWQTYLSVLSAWLGPTVLALSCVMGLSMFLATLSDLISLLTVHMFCFHVYSTRFVVLL